MTVFSTGIALAIVALAWPALADVAPPATAKAALGACASDAPAITVDEALARATAWLLDSTARESPRVTVRGWLRDGGDGEFVLAPSRTGRLLRSHTLTLDTDAFEHGTRFPAFELRARLRRLRGEVAITGRFAVTPSQLRVVLTVDDVCRRR